MFGAALAITRLHLRICPKCDSFALTKTFKQHPSHGFGNYDLRHVSQVTRNFGSWRSAASKRSWRDYIGGWNLLSRQTTSKHSILQRFKTTGYFIPKEIKEGSNPLRLNTNIINNVMLYKFDKDVLMRGSLLFGIFATIGCLFMADNVYLILCKDLMKSEIPLKTRLYDHMFPLAAITVGILAGPAIIIAIWFLTIRTVKYVILHKGGDTVTIVTYHPMKKFKKMTVPLSHVNCQSGREDKKGYVMIEVKGRKYRYMIDKSGHFINPELFDCTVGAARE